MDFRKQVAYFLFCLLMVLMKFQHTTPIPQVATSFPLVEDFPHDPSHLPVETPVVYDDVGVYSPPHASADPSTGQIALITIGVIGFMALCALVAWMYCCRTTTTRVAARDGLELQSLRWKCS